MRYLIETKIINRMWWLDECLRKQIQTDNAFPMYGFFWLCQNYSASERAFFSNSFDLFFSVSSILRFQISLYTLITITVCLTCILELMATLNIKNVHTLRNHNFPPLPCSHMRLYSTINHFHFPHSYSST